MDILNSGSHRWSDNFSDLFDEYIKNCKPKKKQKADFGRLLGFNNYTHMKRELGYWSKENIGNIEAAIIKVEIPELTRVFKKIKFQSIDSKTLTDCFEYLNSIDKLTNCDLNEYIEKGLRSDSSLSLKQVVADELSRSALADIKLTHREQVYFINHHWETLPDLTKVQFTNEDCIKHLDGFALKLITSDLLTFYNKKENMTTSSWSSEISNKIEVPLLLCHKRLVSKQLSTCEILFDTVKQVYTKCHNGSEHEVYVKYAESIGAINDDDKNVIAFFNENCTSHTLKGNMRSSRMEVYYDYPQEQSKVSISSVLRSNSPLSSPVLASYILHCLGDSSFDIERLYACLYVIRKEPALAKLCEVFEPLERLNDTLRYSKDDLKNEVIAVYLLAERIQAVQGGNGITRYIEILNELNSVGRYHLVLTQATRFVEMGALLIEHNIFREPFKYALENASRLDIEALDELEVEAAYYFAIKEGITSGLLNIYTSEEMLENGQFLSEEWILPLMRTHQIDNKLLRSFQDITGHQQSRHRHGRYYDAEYNKNFIWMLNTCASKIETEEIRFAVTKKIATTFRGNNYRRDDNYVADINNLTKNQVKLINIIQESANNYVHISPIQFIALDFFLKNKKTNKKDILVTQYSNMCSTIINQTLHVFVTVDTDVLAEYVTKFDIKEIIYYHSPYITSEHKEGEYEHRNDPVIGRNARVEKTTISNINSDTLEEINKLTVHIEKLNSNKFKGSNPVSRLAERLSPKFYFMNKEFNTNGTLYSPV